jgi:asparagine synthase (glutamine-hydrolysing)
MPGIVGFAGKSEFENGHQLVDQMLKALDQGDVYHLDTYYEPSIGLGRVSLGIRNLESQPVWNVDKSICIVMEGELFDHRDLRQDLLDRGHRFQHDNDAELIIHLYEEYGENFPVKLNGAFIAAIWDKVNRKLTVFNDRLGLYPLYYAYIGGNLFFASGVRSLLVNPSLPKDIDPVAIAQFLTFDHVLDDRTLLESVRLLPQGSLMVFQDRNLSIDRYWEISYPHTYPLRSEFDYMEEFLALMRQAISRQSPKGIPAGILLSGGLDSRVLLAFLAGERESIHSFTWGIPNCDDARYAREIARQVGSDHHFFELKPDWLVGKADEAVRLTDGMGNLVNMHALASLDEEAKHAQIIYKGFLGDAMFGYGLRHQLWANYDHATRQKAHFQVHLDQGVITFTPQEQEKYYTDEFKRRVSSSVSDSYLAGMDASHTDILANQRLYFDYRQRVPRMTIKGVEVVRSKAMVRLPFCDNDLVEFSLRIPPGLMYERSMVKNAFIREFPKLAQIPTTETGFPLMLCSRDVLIRAKHVVYSHLNSQKLKNFLGPIQQPYQDYQGWFRNELRGWVEQTLLNPGALNRGYLKPECIREVVLDHMAGRNHSVKLGALLTLERWHQQYLN